MSQRLAILTLAWICLAVTASAQNRFDLRIEVDRDGLHEVTYESLSALLGDQDLLAERMTLSRAGRPVPIWMRGVRNGRFGPRSAFVFYGEQADGRHTRKAGGPGLRSAVGLGR